MKAHFWPVLSVCAGLSLGCGFRTDPQNAGQVCVDANGDGGETGDTGGGGNDMPGSCSAPIDFPPLPGNLPLRVRGGISGCSTGDESWCGANGGEDYYRLPEPDVPRDVTVQFIPDETDFAPVFRVVRSAGVDPCDPYDVISTEVCTDIDVGADRFSWLAEPGYEYYVIVDSRFGTVGEYGFDITVGPGGLDDSCLDDPDTEEIVLGVGGEFIWNDTIEEGQGIIDGACGGLGRERVFPLTTTSGGTLRVTAIPIDGSSDAAVSLRDGCAATSELACSSGGNELVFDLPGPFSSNLAVDFINPEGGPFQLIARLE